MGWTEYEPIAAQYRVPIVVTGFEPVDILEGIALAVRQLEEGRHEVENQYVRAVTRAGTVPARDLVEQVFELADRKWRGIGEIPRSGLVLRDGVRRLRRGAPVRPGRHRRWRSRPSAAPATCCAGTLKPHQCPAFGTPLHAGAPARRADGLVGGRLRGVLQLRPPPGGRGRRSRDDDGHPGAAVRSLPRADRGRRPGPAGSRLGRQDERGAPQASGSCRTSATRSWTSWETRRSSPLNGERHRRLHRHLRGAARSSFPAATSARWRCTAR